MQVAVSVSPGSITEIARCRDLPALRTLPLTGVHARAHAPAMTAMTRFAPLPEPPYYAVIFANQAAPRGPEADDYEATAARMVALAQVQPGYLGVESTRDEHGFGITVSYWRDEASIAAWKAEVEHAAARERGRERWYERYALRVSKVERAYGWSR